MIDYKSIITKAKQPVGIFYIMLFGVALYFLAKDVGIPGAIRFIATIYCILQVFRNCTRLQILIRNNFKLKRSQYIPLILTSIIVGLLVLLVLNDYLRRFVIFGSIFMFIGFILFEVYQILKRRIKGI